MPLYLSLPVLLVLFGAIVALYVALDRLGRRMRAAAEEARPPVPVPPPRSEPVAGPVEDPLAREQLGRLEAALDELAAVVGDLSDRVGRLEAGRGEEVEALREGLAGLQTGLEALQAEVQERPPADDPASEPEPDPATIVLDHLVEAGCTDVVLLPDGDDAWRVEARREGVLVKGRARLFPGGRVESRLAPPTQAFP